MKKEHKIGLLGLGTVGSGVWKILSEKKDLLLARTEHQFTIKKILVRDLKKKRSVSVPSSLLVSKPDDILKDPEIDIIVELMGGHEPAGSYIVEALQGGKFVVTANKALLAERGVELFKLAHQKGSSLGFEASVAGGIPIIKSIREGFVGNQIQELYGIINGTSNFVLSEMFSQGSSFEEALKKAQKSGYAEQDPALDIKGIDAAQKLSLLAMLSFGIEPPREGIFVEGIDRITERDVFFAKKLGYVIKLLAIGRDQEKGLELRVHPTFVPQKHPLAEVHGVLNAIFLKGDAMGEMMLMGRGAGMMPTASAVVSDIVQVSLGSSIPLWTQSFKPATLQSIEDIVSEYYVRFEVIDKPGVLAQISQCLGDSEISIASVYQEEKGGGVRVPLVIMTHESKESQMRLALEKINRMDSVVEPSLCIRVLKL